MMGPKETCLSIRGSFSWGFTSNQKKEDDKKDGKKKGGKKDKVAEASDEDSKESSKGNEKKPLSKFVTLNGINMQIKKGEFITIIGDVGSGKSSLLHSIIGDLIYIPQGEIDEFGGLDFEGTQEDFD